MRLINADALIDDLEHDVVMDHDSLDHEELTDANRETIQFDKACKQNAIELLKHAPTIEPERKRGKWIGYLEPGCENYHCDICGTAWSPEDLYLGGNDFPKFCPECGAEMENWKTGYGEDGADMREEYESVEG